MKTYTKTSDGLLQQIANIERMEPGKLCIIGQGKDGPFYNLQCRENGKPVSRYVSRDQFEEVKENTENYRIFQKLVDQYAQQIIAQTREERLNVKKKEKTYSSDSRKKNSRD
jgi:heat shock protein HspQ